VRQLKCIKEEWCNDPKPNSFLKSLTTTNLCKIHQHMEITIYSRCRSTSKDLTFLL
jgi:hypothetical protein